MTSRILKTATLATLALAVLACSGDNGGTPTPAPIDEGPGRLPQFTATESPPAASGWRTLAPMPTPRSEVAVAAVGGRIYVVGGFLGNGSPSDAVEVYDPATDTWTQAPPLPEPRHHTAAAGVADIFLYIIGGFGTSFSDPQSTVYKYDTTRQTWEERAPLPTARGGHAVTADACPGLRSACLYAIGGSDEAGENVPEVEAYDDVTNTWSAAASIPTPRDHLIAQQSGAPGYIFAIGGRRNVDFGRNLDANEEYDADIDSWTSRAPLPTARSGIASAFLRDRIYVFGGEGNEGTFAENEVYSAQTDTWETLAPMPTARHGLGAAVVGDTIYVIGGGPTPGLSVSGANEAFTP